MIEHTVQVRVRYSETDQMAYVYYGNYASYFEVARVEAFRHIGFSYKEMEEAGIMMPVLEMKTKYIKPAKYDDLLSIKVFIKNKPGIRITFEYEVYNEANILLTVAETTLVFVSSSTGRPTIPPPEFMSHFEKYYSNDSKN